MRVEYYILKYGGNRERVFEDAYFIKNIYTRRTPDLRPQANSTPACTVPLSSFLRSNFYYCSDEEQIEVAKKYGSEFEDVMRLICKEREADVSLAKSSLAYRWP